MPVMTRSAQLLNRIDRRVLRPLALLALLGAFIWAASQAKRVPVSPVHGQRQPPPTVGRVVGDWTLICFTAEWSEGGRRMLPELARFETEQPSVQVVRGGRGPGAPGAGPRGF